MMEFLLPETDAGVLAQAVLAIVLLAAGFTFTRGHRDRRVFVWGLTVITVAGFGLRSLH